jgi:phosphoribosylaminoimidazolecarboxamide formyltransferase/IMP cyclohydrolase
MDLDIKLNNPFVNSKNILRYGENPHQPGVFYGDYGDIFDKLHGKELSYNNLVDVDAAIQLMKDLIDFYNDGILKFFAIIKHTNVCGIAARRTVKAAWDAALAGDSESAFGGVLVCSGTVNKATAKAINELFFEVIIAPAYDKDALDILCTKKNRIILLQKPNAYSCLPSYQYKSILNGVLVQQNDTGNFLEWKEVAGKKPTKKQKQDLAFANIICKHLKSNAIALVKNMQLLGKGCGQTSRIDAVRHAIKKAKQFKFDLKGAVLSSDAFFPFDDCVKIAHKAGITSFIQPGGSIRDKDSVEYCCKNDLSMVITSLRHFKH